MLCETLHSLPGHCGHLDVPLFDSVHTHHNHQQDWKCHRVGFDSVHTHQNHQQYWKCHRVGFDSVHTHHNHQQYWNYHRIGSEGEFPGQLFQKINWTNCFVQELPSPLPLGLTVPYFFCFAKYETVRNM